jgi:prevent-host-death family protein
MAGQTWQASEARNNFPELMKLALSGDPQFVRHRNGDEVVIISRKDFDALRPTIKDFFLAGGPCEDDDELEEIIARNRASGIGLFGRSNVEK